MRNALKFTALILCIALLFSACTGKKTPEETTTEPESSTVNTESDDSSGKGDGKIVLPYNEADGLNPYFARSNENLYICRMLFDSLFSVDEKGNAVPKIAKSVTVDGNKAVVQLRNDANCKGSQPINANDVVYSFNLAKASYGFGSSLNGIAGADATGSYTVVFNLDFSDALVGAKLNFPVVKQGTADIQTAVPTGSGDYYCLEKTLISMSNAENKIFLYPIDTSKSAENTFKIGSTDVFFSDLSDCEYTSVVGKTEEVLLNNMVYLGFNSENGALSKYVRSAVAAKLNCEDVVISAYQGHGKAVKLPVKPDSSASAEEYPISTEGDKTLAENILDRAGFIQYSGRAKTNGAYSLSFNLIVNRDNKYRLAAAYNIADSLNEIGFSITVHPLSFDDYSERIASGNYHMYLGEVKLDASMDLSQFFTEGGALCSGIDLSGKSATDYFKFRAGKISADDYYKSFVDEYPFVPVLFRTGYVVTSSDVTVNLSQNSFDLYNNL